MVMVHTHDSHIYFQYISIITFCNFPHFSLPKRGGIVFPLGPRSGLLRAAHCRWPRRKQRSFPRRSVDSATSGVKTWEAAKRSSKMSSDVIGCDVLDIWCHDTIHLPRIVRPYISQYAHAQEWSIKKKPLRKAESWWLYEFFGPPSSSDSNLDEGWSKDRFVKMLVVISYKYIRFKTYDHNPRPSKTPQNWNWMPLDLTPRIAWSCEHSSLSFPFCNLGAAVLACPCYGGCNHRWRKCWHGRYWAIQPMIRSWREDLLMSCYSILKLLGMLGDLT